MKQFLGKAKDITGEKFGRLTAIKRVGSNPKNRNAMWLCRCECGTEKIIDGVSLRSGNTKSCGCLKKEFLIKLNENKEIKHSKLALGVASLRKTVDTYKRDAKRRGLKFELTEEQFIKITKMNCHYCGARPNNISKSSDCYGEYVYNGIDRINNSKGYTIDNVVPCCKICNYAKHNLTLKEFQEWAKRLYDKMFGEKK